VHEHADIGVRDLFLDHFRQQREKVVMDPDYCQIGIEETYLYHLVDTFRLFS
jgi:hypothetical protein